MTKWQSTEPEVQRAELQAQYSILLISDQCWLLCPTQGLLFNLQVREKRQDRHYEKRMAKALKNTVKANKTELKKEIHLLKAPHVEKQKIEILEKVPQSKAQKVVPMQTD